MYIYFFIGGYDMEEKAARAYDLAALKYWGPSTHINFPVRFPVAGSFQIQVWSVGQFIFNIA